MKRFFSLLLTLCLLLCLLTPSLAFAKKKTKEAPIPERYHALLEQNNATDVETLYQNILDFMMYMYPDEGAQFTKKRYPLQIRFGGTTKELIADKKNWGMAIVSSKEVDLQTLADKGIIKNWRLGPVIDSVQSQWLLLPKLKALLPKDMNKTYDFYFYDYDEKSDDATLLIMTAKKVDASNIPEGLMYMRSAEQKRGTEGLSRVRYWTEEELLAHPEDWDTAVVRIKLPDKLEQLDQAGLLLDLSQYEQLASRESKEADPRGFGIMPNGLFSEDGRMIGIPYQPAEPGVLDEFEVMVVNPQSAYLERALEYVLHYFKCADWVYSPANTYDPLSDELAAEFWE